MSEVIEEVLEEAGRQDGVADELKVGGQSDNDADEDEDESVQYADNERILYPRCQDFFFGSLLRGERLLNRPPHNRCERCAEFELCDNRIRELTPGSPTPSMTGILLSSSVLEDR